MIKAIQTKYQGYFFRSRLEARWAVYFDKVGIKWEYEKEGFDLNGKWYLPDFYLPSLDAWIEIKPENGDKEEVRSLIIAMMEYGPAHNGKAWGLFGDPLSAWWMMPWFNEKKQNWVNEWPDAGICFEDQGDGLIALPTFRKGGHTPFEWLPMSDEILYSNYHAKVEARSARFEHGETPS